MIRLHAAVGAALLFAFASATVACSDSPEPPSSSKTPPKTAPTVAPQTPTAPIEPTPNVPVTQPGTTPGTTTPGQCTATTGTPSCDTCLQQNCCTSVNACDADQDCGAMDNCVAQCYSQYAQNPTVEQQCEQQCAAQHPNGATKLQAIYQCLGTSCATQCPH